MLYRAQFIPAIAEDPTITVINFVRTAMWYVPRVSLFLGEKYELFFETQTCSTAKHSLFEDRQICICSHSARATYPSLHDRDNSMTSVRYDL